MESQETPGEVEVGEYLRTPGVEGVCRQETDEVWDGRSKSFDGGPTAVNLYDVSKVGLRGDRKDSPPQSPSPLPDPEFIRSRPPGPPAPPSPHRSSTTRLLSRQTNRCDLFMQLTTHSFL